MVLRWVWRNKPGLSQAGRLGWGSLPVSPEQFHSSWGRTSFSLHISEELLSTFSLHFPFSTLFILRLVLSFSSFFFPLWKILPPPPALFPVNELPKPPFLVGNCFIFLGFKSWRTATLNDCFELSVVPLEI